ncbi:MAG: indole-3-glycerol phosphate synthase TrpC [Acidobacteriota bacterium]
MTADPKKFKGILSAGGILDRIVAKRLERLEQAKPRTSFSELVDACAKAEITHRSFSDAISRPDQTNIIAEVKHRSPSKGVIRENFNHLEIAREYAAAGAAAMSVLTEEDFFAGSLNYLQEIHAQTDVPLLRKDFIIDEYQIYEACLSGASAILLITAILDDELLAAFIKRAAELNLDALVEVHTENEMRRAIQADAKIIGVNNRDLTTFNVDLETSIRLAALAPTNAALVSESGITTREDIQKLKAAGYDAFLIGEHFMRQKDIGNSLKALFDD